MSLWSMGVRNIDRARRYKSRAAHGVRAGRHAHREPSCFCSAAPRRYSARPLTRGTLIAPPGITWCHRDRTAEFPSHTRHGTCRERLTLVVWGARWPAMGHPGPGRLPPPPACSFGWPGAVATRRGLRTCTRASVSRLSTLDTFDGDAPSDIIVSEGSKPHTF